MTDSPDEPQTPRTDEGGPELLKLTLKIAEAASCDPRVKSTFRVARERIEQLEQELAQAETQLLGSRRIIDEMGVELRTLQEKHMRIENNTFTGTNTVEGHEVQSVELDTFLMRCILIPRKDGRGPMFFDDGAKVHARLDGYAIIPKELYEELRKAQERCAQAYEEAAKVAEPTSNNPQTDWERGYWAAENVISKDIRALAARTK